MKNNNIFIASFGGSYLESFASRTIHQHYASLHSFSLSAASHDGFNGYISPDTNHDHESW